MPSKSSFYAYSPHQTAGATQKAHVLFQSKGPGWVVVNDTGLEIARHLDKGESVDDVTALLASRYSIPPKVAKQDVSEVSRLLCQANILDKTAEPVMRAPALNSVYFHLTSRCNLSCPHCYVSSPNRNTKSDVPNSVVRRLIDELVDNGGESVTFGGGEPLLHPEIKKILEHPASRLRGQLLTNGTLIDREWASFLADNDLSVQVSIDGSRAEAHDRIRGEGSFNRTLKALEYLQEAGLKERVSFSTTIMRQNLHDLKDIISMAERLQAPLVRFLPLRKIGSARRRWEHIGAGISATDYERFFQYTSELQANRKSTAEVSCGLSGFLLKMPEQVCADDMWCPIGNGIVVGVDGHAYPCVLMMQEQFRLGNVFVDDLTRLMQSQRMGAVCRALADRRHKIQECADCTWRNLCQAGCMGQALDQKGTIWAIDDSCEYRKKAYHKAFDRILQDFSRKQAE